MEGEPIVLLTTLVANISNMPVVARRPVAGWTEAGMLPTHMFMVMFL